MTRRQFRIAAWKFIMPLQAGLCGVAIYQSHWFQAITAGVFGVIALLSFEDEVRADERGGYR